MRYLFMLFLFVWVHVGSLSDGRYLMLGDGGDNHVQEMLYLLDLDTFLLLLYEAEGSVAGDADGYIGAGLGSCSCADGSQAVAEQ